MAHRRLGLAMEAVDYAIRSSKPVPSETSVGGPGARRQTLVLSKEVPLLSV